MVKLADLFCHLVAKKIFVIGDFVIDHYIFGRSPRISPEAPVPVVLVERQEERLGMAGNVAMNLVALGMKVTASGLVGQDRAGSHIIDNLRREGVRPDLFVQYGYETPYKSRVIASSQQVVRIDYEHTCLLDPKIENEVIEKIPEMVAGHDLVAISDYAKGFLTTPILKAVIDFCKRTKIPVIADPKGSDFTKYAGATILKPNLSEAYAAAGHSGPLRAVAETIFKKTKVDTLMITRGDAGISLYYPDGREEDHPVTPREIRDGTGSGDIVLAMLCCALANGLSLSDATALANVAAMCGLEHIGCARVTLGEVARMAIELHSGGKIFGADSEAALEHALAGRDFILLHVDGISEINQSLLRTIRNLHREHKKELLICLQNSGLDEEMVALLASLRDVHYIHLGDTLPSFQSAVPSAIIQWQNQ
jgi:D-beta-D-heptose 7-phosphate kinase/D-beta-D-heptose 1-phosphate adenosyltransferase